VSLFPGQSLIMASERFQPRPGQHGATLIEIMVSLVIGLVVVGAVMVNYLSSGLSGKARSAYSQMSEDAQIAFTIMGRDISQAGYSRAVALVTGGGGTSTMSRFYTGRPIFGCNTAFTSPTATTSTVSCSLTTGHSIEVVYEADSLNALTINGTQRDCLGSSVGTTTLASGTTGFIVYNRYFVKSATAGRPELYCAGGSVGSPISAPIVENVESMTVWYGEAASAASRQPVRYVDAAAVANWSAVVSVRICLLMRSSEPILQSDEAQTLSYVDCSLTSQSIADRYARRAFFSTVALRNKVSF
jgi:type IV pilus assembly protein PilW